MARRIDGTGKGQNMSKDKISIFLRDCRVQLPIGIYGHERTKPQPVVVNIEAETTLTHRFDDPAEDTVARTVSYEAIYTFIHDELPKQGHIYLLESAAERIVDFCFRDPRIHTVTVRLEKSGIIADAIPGISMTRTRMV
jgi:dihydroneopterin aldolase